MNKILEAIEQKMKMGYSSIQLEVDFGYPYEESKTEGFYLSKLNGWGATPITDVLCGEEEVNDQELIAILNEMDIAYSF